MKNGVRLNLAEGRMQSRRNASQSEETVIITAMPMQSIGLILTEIDVMRLLQGMMSGEVTIDKLIEQLLHTSQPEQ